MKKAIICLIISALLITGLAACGKENTPDTTDTTASENTSNEVSAVSQTLERTLDGVTLKVYIENPIVSSGGEVHITATVTNNSGKDIVSTLPIYNQLHYEIRTKILTQDKKAFYDKDYPIEVGDDATRQFVVENGKSYVQDMYLVAAEMNPSMNSTADAVPYGAGKCTGTSIFKWDGDAGSEKSLTVCFDIEIV